LSRLFAPFGRVMLEAVALEVDGFACAVAAPAPLACKNIALLLRRPQARVRGVNKMSQGQHQRVSHSTMVGQCVDTIGQCVIKGRGAGAVCYDGQNGQPLVVLLLPTGTVVSSKVNMALPNYLVFLKSCSILLARAPPPHPRVS
jgi:hypothetical protein